MVRRLVGWFVLLPLSAVLVVFALANRDSVQLRFDPIAAFSGQDGFIPSLQMPLFVVIYVVLILGIILGGIATWFTQGRQRVEKRRWRKEAKKLEQDQEKRVRENKIQAERVGDSDNMLDAS